MSFSVKVATHPDVASGRCHATAAGRCEVDPVQKVEHLRAKLDRHPLPDLRVLEHGEVNIGKSRSVISVASRRPKRPRRRIRKGRRIQPVHLRVLTLVALRRIADLHRTIRAFVRSTQIARRRHTERLTAVKGHQRIHLPAVGQLPRPMRRSRHRIAEEAHKRVARIEVRVAVVPLEVRAVLRQRAAIRTYLVKIMAPGVRGRRRKMVPVRQPQLRLQRVVVRRANALQLVDHAILRIAAEVRSRRLPLLRCRRYRVRRIHTRQRLVDIKQTQQMPPWLPTYPICAMTLGASVRSMLNE